MFSRHYFFCPAVLVLTLLCLIILGQSDSSLAGETTDRWGFGLEGGVMKLTEGYWDYSNADQFGALVVARGLDRHWNLQLMLKYGHLRPGAETRKEDVGWSSKSSVPLYNVILQPMVHL